MLIRSTLIAALTITTLLAGGSAPVPGPARADAARSAAIDLLPAGSAWRYRDTGEDLGTAWRAPGYDDSAWASGPAPLGYSDPVSTTVGYGPNPAAKYITTYFRTTFTVTDPLAYTALSLGLRRDDGAIVYLNGNEVARSNMPAGTVTTATLAASGIGEDQSFHPFSLPITALLAGPNVFAVEIHQASPGSSDIGFDLALSAVMPEPPPPPPPAGAVRFAIIGDYGVNSAAEADVSALVHGWAPGFIITVGDNNYPLGGADTIDANIGQYYHDFIAPYSGAYGAGSPNGNRFWPATGNHDWYSSPPLQPYLDYFSLPGNERWYDRREGPTHFFFLDSEDMVSRGAVTSTQAAWLQGALAASDAPWKIVVLHHPAYSSGPHGNTPLMQWPFEEWGATAVLQGHDHLYERFAIGNIPYFVDGSGGYTLYGIASVQPGSVVRYNADYGAMRVEANDCAIVYQFFTRTGALIDTHTQTRACGRPATRFAVIGDYGAAASGNPTYIAGESSVAALISDTLRPDFVLTVGDNNYGTRPPQGSTPDTRGSAEYIDQNIGAFYHRWITPYLGTQGAGSPDGNRFFPALGNADWFQPYPTSTVAISVALAAHFDYFPWLEQRLYYTFTAPGAPGVIEVFVTSVDSRDPDRLQLAASPQRAWLQNGLAQSTSAWQIAVVHYPPFKSEGVTSTASYSGAVNLRLSYADWGADAVLSGDAHLYERVMVGPAADGRSIPYFIDGMGGAGLASFGAGVLPIPGSAARDDAHFGAQLVEASSCHLTFTQYAADGTPLDTWTVLRDCLPIQRVYLPAVTR